MERREGKDGGEMDERKIVANDRRRLGAGFPYENQGVHPSTACLIFINYINSPRRGRPVDWVTRIVRLSPPLTLPSFAFFLFRFLKSLEQKGGGRQVFMGSLKTWNTGCQRYRDHYKWPNRHWGVNWEAFLEYVERSRRIRKYDKNIFNYWMTVVVFFISNFFSSIHIFLKLSFSVDEITFSTRWIVFWNESNWNEY